MQTNRVAITGVGMVTSLGREREDFWSAICSGKSGVSNIESFDTTEYDVHFASEVKGFEPAKCLGAKDARRLDRFAQFAVFAAIIATEDADLDFDKEDPTRVGVIIGSGIGGLLEIETQHSRLIEKGPSRVSPFMIPKLMVNAASGQVSIRFGLKGPNSAVATACASGTHAIGDAFKVIQRGEADMMITGGSEAAVTPMGISGFASMKALSRRNLEPTKASRPFDKDRDGFVMGEGSGILVLEQLEHARRRGAHIYAEVLGYGMSGDGSHITLPDPEGRGAAKSMLAALADASCSPQDIAYINAHGTSTPSGDLVETKAIKHVFDSCAPRTPISSSKSMLGHLLGASGGVELIITALAVQNGAVPPTINYEVPDPECDLDYVPNEARQTRVERAMSNSFGFGGHNATLIIGKLGD